MESQVSPIIEVSDLFKIIHSETLILIDASNGPNAKSNYNLNHLDEARFVDLNSQLAQIEENVALGGRHPLPPINEFAKTLAQLGISKDSHVIVYDDKNSSNAAARFWWMLRAVGHEKVQVLNGGFAAAEKAKFPINSNEVNVNKSSEYVVSEWQLPIALMDEVEAVSQSENHLVIDVRDAMRYAGETEPIDLIAGHIPGAINVPFTENLDEKGLFLSPEILQKKYEAILKKTEIEKTIVHCGSGVTACHTLLALVYAGFEIPKLYVGSWSEWSRNGKVIEGS
jgi:thiosulfate/3-mercaptopyruvate sulfurtransferase